VAAKQLLGAPSVSSAALVDRHRNTSAPVAERLDDAHERRRLAGDLVPAAQRRPRRQRQGLTGIRGDEDRVGVVVEAACPAEIRERLAELADALDRAVLEDAGAVAVDPRARSPLAASSTGSRSSAG